MYQFFKSFSNGESFLRNMSYKGPKLNLPGNFQCRFPIHNFIFSAFIHEIWRQPETQTEKCSPHYALILYISCKESVRR